MDMAGTCCIKEENTMGDINAIGATGTQTYTDYQTKSVVKASEETVENAAEDGVVYEKSEDTKSATYSINKMSEEDRAALVQQLKEDQEARYNQFMDLVRKMITGQTNTYAKTDENIWQILASGNFTVDAETKAQAQADISEDGYWGVKQTSQRLFDFASALAGDDVDKMKKMQEAMEKGFKLAASEWGRDLPDISNDTLSAANKLFEDYYASKETETV